MKVRTAFILFLLLAYAACTNRAESEIQGSWQAYEILEEGVPLELDPAEIRFEFREDRGYSFFSTLNYREKGAFRVQAGYLYTRDSLQAGAIEKAVRIERFSTDTLVLEMSDQGKNRLLKLHRSAE
ncbi:MAG: lipocalin family protein [Saprospirales bacterium]|nr:lipocalin family protein [Saprospirales bacterium]